jgi:hypothetical protein
VFEAILTMYPAPERVKPNPRGLSEAASIMRQGARLGSKVNERESVINLVKSIMPKMLTGMNQNGAWAGFGLTISEAGTTKLTGEEPTPNLPMSLTQNTESPYFRPLLLWAGRPQGRLLRVRVWEVGESECRAVTARIRAEGRPDIVLPEREQTSDWSLFARKFGEPSQRRTGK